MEIMISDPYILAQRIDRLVAAVAALTIRVAALEKR